MSDFAHISKEEHQDWLRSPATSAALADLREQHELSEESALTAAASESIETIRYNAGFAAGIDHAIHYLTKERK